MAQRFHSIVSKLKNAAIAVFFFVGLGLAGYFPLGGQVSSGDEWRRTADGWQRIADWPSAKVSGRFVQASSARAVDRVQSARLDTHPAVLALVELVAILLALYSFPFGRQRPLTPRDGWIRFLARSYRASVFGS